MLKLIYSKEKFLGLVRKIDNENPIVEFTDHSDGTIYNIVFDPKHLKFNINTVEFVWVNIYRIFGYMFKVTAEKYIKQKISKEDLMKSISEADKFKI